MKNVAIIGIGSNVEDSFKQVEECCCKISAEVSSARFSSIYKTKAVGETPQPDYCNCVGLIETDMQFDELNLLFKNMERAKGRTSEDKKSGRVIIDIDIVVWNNEIKRPKDFERSYTTIGLKELDLL